MCPVEPWFRLDARPLQPRWQLGRRVDNCRCELLPRKLSRACKIRAPQVCFVQSRPGELGAQYSMCSPLHVRQLLGVSRRVKNMRPAARVIRAVTRGDHVQV